MPTDATIMAALDRAFTSPVVVLAGVTLATLGIAQWLARAFAVPRLCAEVVAGFLLTPQPSILEHALSTTALHAWLEAFSVVLLFEVGNRISPGWLYRNPALLLTSVLESTTVFIAVFALLAGGLDQPRSHAAVIAAIAVAASPVVVLAVSKDLHARGQVTERALLLATLSNIYAVVTLHFLIAAHLVAADARHAQYLEPILALLGAGAIGFAFAVVLRAYAAVAQATGAALSLGVFAACAATYVVADVAGVSPSLAALALGIGARVLDRAQHLRAFELSEAGHMLTLGFFVLTGLTLEWPPATTLVAVGFAIALVRLVTRVLVVGAMAPRSGLSRRRGVLVAVASVPISGLAVLLATSLTAYPGLGAAVPQALAVVLVLGLLGPAATEIALRRAGECSPRQ